MEGKDIGKEIENFTKEIREVYKKYGFEKKKVGIYNGKKKHVGDAIFLRKDGDYCVKNFREIIEDCFGEIGI